MFKRSSEKYVVIQEHIPLHEQRALERAIVTVLTPVRPSQAFVEQLSHDLTEEARQQYEAQRRHVNRALRAFGIVGGGLASMIGGIAIWLLVHREGQTTAPRTTHTRTQRQTAVSAG